MEIQFTLLKNEQLDKLSAQFVELFSSIKNLAYYCTGIDHVSRFSAISQNIYS